MVPLVSLLILPLTLFTRSSEAAPLESDLDKRYEFTYFGCFSELTGGLHVLNHQFDVPNPVFSVSACLDVCYNNGFSIGAVMNGNECWCDNAMSSKAVRLAQEACSLPCENNPTEICGGPQRLQMYYELPGGATHINPVIPSSTGGAPAPYHEFIGCFVDSSSSRTLRAAFVETGSNTPAFCNNYCFQRGYQFAGVEWGKECFCGDEIFNFQAVSTGDCHQACAGDSTLACGGPSRLQIYTAIPSLGGPYAAPATGQGGPTTWVHIGCYIDRVTPRTISGYSYTASSMTAHTCTAECFKRGYGLAGVEFGTECYCGHGATPNTARVDISECTSTCGGDSSNLCGGPARMNVYKSVSLP